LGLADGPGVLGVHFDAVGTAVELGGPDADQLAQLCVDAGLVEFLGGGVVSGTHSKGETGRVAVEVEPDGDLRGGCGVGHDSNLEAGWPTSKVHFYGKRVGHFQSRSASGTA